MTAGTIIVLLLVLLGLVLLALAWAAVPAKRSLLAAGLFAWLLAWAILDVLPKLTG